MVLVGLPILFLFAIMMIALFPDVPDSYFEEANLIIVGFLIFMLWLPFEALFISLWGTTPAKWLFGIQVVKISGEKLSYIEALQRTALVFVQGMAFGIPIIALFTHLYFYRRLIKTGVTSWDTRVGSVVLHKEWGIVRAFLIILITVTCLMSLAMLNSME